MRLVNETTANVLVVDRATVVRDETRLLSNINLQLRAGEILSVLGPNGAGKSTLILAIANELSLSAGDIRINNVSLSHWNAAELAAVRAFNGIEPPLAFSMTVFDYVALGRPFAEVECDAILSALARCHARVWMNRDAASLSSGELLRVQLARSLYQLNDTRPALWLLDEPTAHLDPSQRKFVLELLRDVASENAITVVFSTHEPRDAQAIANQTLLLKRGESVAYGDTGDVLHRAALASLFDLAESDFASINAR